VDFSLTGLSDLSRQHRQSSNEMVCHCADLVCADILDLPIRNQMYDAVVEKGLLDAMMTCYDESSQYRSGKVFSEYARVLKPGCPASIVTLAQEHMVRLFQDTLLTGASGSLWERLTIEPLYPSQPCSPLLPFCFKFFKVTESSANDKMMPAAVSLKLSKLETTRTMDQWEVVVKDIVDLQEAFASQFRSSVQMDDSTHVGPTHILFTIDLKPEDDETDLKQLSRDVESLISANKGIRMIECETAPLAYGLMKLVLKGTLPLTLGQEAETVSSIIDVEGLCEALEELSGVMSVDIVDSQPCKC
jgi:translation elongation factor EF-1beta